MNEHLKINGQLEVNEANLANAVQAAVEKHGRARDALIPILGEVNRAFGYIPAQTYAEIRTHIHAPDEGLFLADSVLFSVASFYHMFSLQSPGRHVIRFCESAPCHVMGAREVIGAIEKTLGIQPGETSPDKRWTLLMTSCLGVCGVGPVFLVDNDLYGNVLPEQVPEILGRYREDGSAECEPACE